MQFTLGCSETQRSPLLTFTNARDSRDAQGASHATYPCSSLALAAKQIARRGSAVKSGTAGGLSVPAFHVKIGTCPESSSPLAAGLGKALAHESVRSRRYRSHQRWQLAHHLASFLHSALRVWPLCGMSLVSFTRCSEASTSSRPLACPSYAAQSPVKCARHAWRCRSQRRAVDCRASLPEHKEVVIVGAGQCLPDFVSAVGAAHASFAVGRCVSVGCCGCRLGGAELRTALAACWCSLRSP